MSKLSLGSPRRQQAPTVSGAAPAWKGMLGTLGSASVKPIPQCPKGGETQYVGASHPTFLLGRGVEDLGPPACPFSEVSSHPSVRFWRVTPWASPAAGAGVTQSCPSLHSCSSWGRGGLGRQEEGSTRRGRYSLLAW